MIDSGIYSKSTIKMNIQQIKFEDLNLQQVTVQKQIMFHLINSYMLSIFMNKQYEELQKLQIAQQYGQLLGFNLAQEECIGFLKYTKSQKNDNKQFVGEMKLLNSRIWTIVIGSKGKLFAVSADTTLVNSYRIEDKQFKLGKSVSGQNQKQYKKLLLNFCNGLIVGVLKKFLISGQIICAQNLESGGIYLQLKNLVKKDDQINSLQKMKSNIF